MFESSIQQCERRGSTRFVPAAPIGVVRTKPVLPLGDAQVLDASTTGVALSTRVPLHPGDRLSFTIAQGMPPVVAEVLAREPLSDGCYRIRCRCVLGGFEPAQGAYPQINAD